MKTTANLVAAFALGAVMMFALTEFLPQRSEMLTVAFNQKYTPTAFVPRATHIVATEAEVLDLCGGTERKFGCMKQLGNTVQFVCLKSKLHDCQSHEYDHLVRGPRHAGQ